MADHPPLPHPPSIPTAPQKIHLGVISFGLAVGVTGALFTFVLGLAAGMLGWGILLVEILAHLFIGYAPHFVGSVTGAVWAFVDGLVAGMLVAWLYNVFLRSRR